MTLQLRIEGPGLAKRYPLPLGVTTIGRRRQTGDLIGDVEPDILIDTPQLGRRHLRIERSATGVTITDLGDRYGTHLNDKRLDGWTPTAIRPGAVLTLGLDYRLTLEETIQPQSSTATPSDGTRPALAMIMPEALPTLYDPYHGQFPPGLGFESVRLLSYLPEIYQPDEEMNRLRRQRQSTAPTESDFLTRFLALFESVLLPIEWNIANFDLFLEVGCAPEAFLPWFEEWHRWTTALIPDGECRRALLVEADQLFAMRGTRYALSRVLELYTGTVPEIIESGEQGGEALPPFSFRVITRPASPAAPTDPRVIDELVDLFKPAHAIYLSP